MKLPRTLFIIFLIFAIHSCTSEKEALAQQWYKGNLHTHSYWSDGDEFPEVILDWYKTRGYNFLALSDHNTISEGEKWKTISEDSLHQNAFKSYLKTYGADWVQYKIDSGKTLVKLTPYQEYRDLFEEGGKFLVIHSEEITDRFQNKPLHMNATNIQHKIAPQGGNSVAEVLQNNIDQVLAQRKETGIPIMPHVNHPNFGYGISLNDMLLLKGDRFFEVFNGHPMVHNMGDSTHVSTEEMWDLINISYIKSHKPLMYGMATDDSHHYHKKGSKWSNAGRGWVMVQADTLSAVSLINAMEAGKFYASTGVTLKEVAYKNQQLSVAVKEEPGVHYTIHFIGALKSDETPTQLTVVKGTQASFKVTDDLLFVRCKVTSTKKVDNPIEDLLYEMAWTQPVVPD